MELLLRSLCKPLEVYKHKEVNSSQAVVKNICQVSSISFQDTVDKKEETGVIYLVLVKILTQFCMAFS